MYQYIICTYNRPTDYYEVYVKGQHNTRRTKESAQDRECCVCESAGKRGPTCTSRGQIQSVLTLPLQSAAFLYIYICKLEYQLS